MATSGVPTEWAPSQIPTTFAQSHLLSNLSGDKLRQIALMGQQARILVIDNSLPIAEALAASLVAQGLETHYALSGVEALQRLTFGNPTCLS
ncbi:hypothetical protein R75465_06536 [Paraburkholderia aspalathi]|nr:hypothetical protein R75465_06536 [Paraburkholderia aspalathi]